MLRTDFPTIHIIKINFGWTDTFQELLTKWQVRLKVKWNMNALPINKFMRISICSGLCVDSRNMKLPSNHGIPWQDISKAFMRGLRFPRGEVARAQTLHFCVSRRSMAEIDRTKESMFFINLTSGASFLPPPFPLRLRLCMFDILTKFALYKLNKIFRTALSLRSPHFWESRKWMSSGIASKFRPGITLFPFLYHW